MSVKIKELAELVSANPEAEILVKNQDGKTINVELDVLEKCRFLNNVVLTGEFYDAEDYDEVDDEKDSYRKDWIIASNERDELETKCEYYEGTFSEIKDESRYSADEDIKDIQKRLDNIYLLIEDLGIGL